MLCYPSLPGTFLSPGMASQRALNPFKGELANLTFKIHCLIIRRVVSSGKQLIVAVYPVRAELNLKVKDKMEIENKSIIAADYEAQKQMVCPLLSQILSSGNVW